MLVVCTWVSSVPEVFRFNALDAPLLLFMDGSRLWAIEWRRWGSCAKSWPRGPARLWIDGRDSRRAERYSVRAGPDGGPIGVGGRGPEEEEEEKEGCCW